MMNSITDEQLNKFLDNMDKSQVSIYGTKAFVPTSDGNFKKVQWSPTHRRVYLWWVSVQTRYLDWKVKHERHNSTGIRH